MAGDQDWCLMCGAGAPGSLGSSGWRPLFSVLGVVLVLALGAAAAAYAALEKGSGKAHVLTTTVAQTPPPATTTPATTTPTTPSPGATTPSSATPGVTSTKPPKIPLTAVTPKASEKTVTTTSPASSLETGKTTASTPTTTTPSTGKSPSESERAGEENQQSAILLDTDAAQTYNPYNYSASWFGDPSLAIDGDPTTGWTAQVNPATAPNMAEGLIIDLKQRQKVSVAQLITSTPGMTVQVYGARAAVAPTSITDPAWVPLTGPKVAKKKKLRLKLRDAKKAFTFIALWISKAPASAIGTAEAPGHVTVDELELFPTTS